MTLNEMKMLYGYQIKEGIAVKVLEGVVEESRRSGLSVFGGVSWEVAVEGVERMVEEWDLKVGQDTLLCLVRIARQSSTSSCCFSEDLSSSASGVVKGSSAVGMGRMKGDDGECVQFVMSILRWAMKLKLELKWELLKECFDCFVEGGDLNRAVGLMNYMKECGMFGGKKSALKRRREMEVYRGVLEITVRKGYREAARMIRDEMLVKKIGMLDAGVQSVMVAYCVLDGQVEKAREIMRKMRRKGMVPTALAYQTMMKAERENRNATAVLHLLEEVEEKWCGAAGGRSQVVLQEHEQVLRAAFEGLRAAAAGRKALDLLERLTYQYQNYKPSAEIYTVVIETCWRANMLDAAIKLRRELEKQRRKTTRLTRDQKTKLKEDHEEAE